jgi:hypothetical protein
MRSHDLILAYWYVIDSYGTSIQHTDMLLILMWPLTSTLICYSFSYDLIPAYWCVIDPHVYFSMLAWGSMRINSILCWKLKVTRESITHQYARMRSRENQQHFCNYSSRLMFYCHVTSFHHTNLLLILMWPHSIILRYCWFSWYLIPPYHIRIINTSVCWNEATW